MNFRPLNDRVVVKRLEVDEMTEGGIHIPTTSQAPPNQGVVLAVGRGIFVDGGFQECTVKIGDHVLFAQHAGHKIELEGDEFEIMREADIFGIIKHAEDEE